MKRIPFVFATAVVATAAGCGSQASHTFTKSQVISQGTTICKHAEAEVSALPQLTTQHPFAARDVCAGAPDGTQLPRRLRQGARRLSRRPGETAAPSDGKELLDAYLTGIGKVAAELRAAAKAPDAQVEPAVGQAFTLFDTREREHRVSTGSARASALPEAQ